MSLRPIDQMTDAELDQLAVTTDRQRPLKFKYRLLRDLSLDPQAKPSIIKDIIVRGETSYWVAPPGGLKSALLCELAFSVATRTDWHGYRAKQSGAVIYFALERADLTRRRLTAHLARYSEDVERPPVAIVSAMIDLMNPATVKDVVALIRSVEQDTGEPVVLVIFDTFAKLMAAGGGDENLARDHGKVFANLQRLKNEIGCHVALIGHTGKDESRGSRGSNASKGDVDVEVMISGDIIKTATVIKANDAPEGALFSFKSETHEFGMDEDGDPITVNIVSAEEVSTQSASKAAEPKLTTNQRILFRILHDAGSAGLTQDEWYAKAKTEGIGTKAPARLTEARYALQDRKLIRQYIGRWYANQS
jgi:hypothetical protein